MQNNMAVANFFKHKQFIILWLYIKLKCFENYMVAVTSDKVKVDQLTLVNKGNDQNRH